MFKYFTVRNTNKIYMNIVKITGKKQQKKYFSVTDEFEPLKQEFFIVTVSLLLRFDITVDTFF
jgi:type III secretory pathway component EscU